MNKQNHKLLNIKITRRTNETKTTSIEKIEPCWQYHGALIAGRKRKYNDRKRPCGDDDNKRKTFIHRQSIDSP